MTSSRALPQSFVVANTTMLWLATAIASAELWPIYQSPQFIVLVIVTVGVGTLIAIGGARYRWSSLVVLLATVAAYFAIGVPLAVPSRALFGVLPTLDGLVELATGTALSWKQLVTITPPVGSYQSLLVPALVLLLVTTVVGLSTTLRGRWGELGVLGPVALFVAGILFGPATAVLPLQIALGLLGVVLLWIAWQRWYRRREQVRLLAAYGTIPGGAPVEATADRGLIAARSLIGAVLIIALAAGSSVAAALALPPTTSRQVIRTSIEKPFDPRSYPSPLSGFRRYEEPGVADSTMLTVAGLPADGRIRIATLDSYDGIVYAVGSDAVLSESGSFTRVPYTFDQSAVTGRRVTLTVTVGSYSGVWVPTVGKFESIAFAGNDAAALRDSFYYNNASGTAAVVKQLRTGDAYTLSAVLPRQPDDSQLAAVGPGAAAAPRIGVLPENLLATLDGWVKGVDGGGKRLVAMIAALKKAGYVSHGVSADEPASRSGHAADRITQLLTDQRMIGDQEQYAVTAALMARQLGFPARVVFGFAPQDANAGGATRVLGKDVSAWIEVDTAQYGWVTIDPTPPVREIPAEQPKDPTTISRPQSPVQPPVEDQKSDNSPVPPDSTQDQPVNLSPILVVLLAVLRILGWVAVGAAILLAPFAAIVAAKVRRRVLRKKAPTPLQRISGGWQEFENSVVDRGYTPPPYPTRIEVAATVGGLKSLVLATVADRAIFSPNVPRAEEADQVWRSVEAMIITIDRGRTRRERIRAAISLRSLGGYSVKELFKR
ncbi:transglutaminase-like domain-containing protein [Lacisediminihabitans sp.]|jgi:hypothetical protein|uniref:transglutaminase-like domain-containing protein n=1 Tax=Lacisediminihabitans sp. TaxID=2787631 RepID=UPI002F922C0E